MNTSRSFLSLSAALLATTLAACGGGEPAATAAKAAAQPAAEPALTSIDVPSGHYAVDRNHADLRFEVGHMGLSNYVARFENYSVDIQLDAENIGNSSVEVVIDPTSIQTGFVGDYKGTHPDSSYDNWEQDLAQSPKFFNAGEYPEVRFTSTQVSPAPGGLKVQGDFSLLGQTHPVTLDVRIVGSAPSHPMTKKGAFGISVSGGFDRSPFGMDFLVKQGLLGDRVRIGFEGEFQQQ